MSTVKSSDRLYRMNTQNKNRIMRFLKRFTTVFFPVISFRQLSAEGSEKWVVAVDTSGRLHIRLGQHFLLNADCWVFLKRSKEIKLDALPEMIRTRTRTVLFTKIVTMHGTTNHIYSLSTKTFFPIKLSVAQWRITIQRTECLWHYFRNNPKDTHGNWLEKNRFWIRWCISSFRLQKSNVVNNPRKGRVHKNSDGIVVKLKT